MASRRASMMLGSGTASPTTGLESRRGSHTRRRLAELAAERKDEEVSKEESMYARVQGEKNMQGGGAGGGEGKAVALGSLSI